MLSKLKVQFCKDKPKEIGMSPQKGEALLFFANMANDSILKDEVLHLLENYTNTSDNETYLLHTLERLKKRYLDYKSNIIMIDVFNSFVEDTDKKTTPDQLKFCLSENLKNIIRISENYISKLNNIEDTSNLLTSFDARLHYSISFSIDNGVHHLEDVYETYDAQTALYFEFTSIAKSKIIIKKCENCHKYFIPISRSDEIYCSNIYAKGKTCKQIGYERKVNNDDSLKAYRKIYKTQNARKNRIKDKDPTNELRFCEWTRLAKEELKKLQNDEISLEQFEKRISSADWMNEEVKKE